ncbi:MAG: transcriptional regulator NrdR [Thermoanaerobaculia bacterium]|nr:transcriptional regulator NrdR [Thermoanaerobaculia bacterium]
MKCPYCGDTDDRVVDSRESRGATTIRRRRECTACGRRYTTYEEVEDIRFLVVKRDGSRQEFDRRKLLEGLRKACEKRPVSAKALDDIVEQVEAKLHESEDREISTREIGETIMSQLSELDQVAYVRFASVYRKFEDIDAFMDELRHLLKQRD